ncbi:actin-like protein [Vairimorpha ceranae]|uniref:Actin-like protein n=1 Tax=Vairimorpha ceranae TaxID=40302 RepID=A0A0F9WFS2_9MICR|nr:actin-like protein [Vairimorpha ceranae]KAF5140888.1 hypothetical protein G9O61_00g008780 [Vairimorpha ceranae]KKO75575.1 actin-like protein [Vairimorpha ceranae]
MIFPEDVSYKVYHTNFKKSDTIIIDNGTYEIKAGYKGDKLALKFLNCFYKDIDGFKFMSVKGKNKYTPFTHDMISGFHALEENFDQIFEYLDVQECNKLIITDSIYSPTKKDLLKFLFDVYHFKEIQIGVDAIYSGLHNNIYDGIIISLGNISICVYVVKNKKILDVYKINYGGKFALQYLTNILRYKFKESNKDYKNLLNYLKCAKDYDQEVFELINKMKVQDYKDSVCISSIEEDKCDDVPVDPEKRNRMIERLRNINRKTKIKEEIGDESTSEDNPSSESTIPDEEEHLSTISEEKETKEKRNMPGMYKIRLYQFNAKIQKIFKRLARSIEKNEEEYEKETNLSSWLTKKKLKYEKICREIELRDKLRKDSTNRKTYEFGLLLKTGELTSEEVEYKKKIKDAENLKIDEKLNVEKEDLLDLISNYDSNYILNTSTMFDLVTCKNLDKIIINIDLFRVAEVIFEPSLVGSDQMGLGEILEILFKSYKDITNVFITGGFSQIYGLKERLEFECKKYAYRNDIVIKMAENPVDDAFNGARFYEMFETYKYEDYLNGIYDS